MSGQPADANPSRPVRQHSGDQSAHTPGLWRVFENGETFQIVNCATDYVVATARNREDAEAIAIVPNILAALWKCHEACMNNAGRLKEETWTEIKAALCKAGA